MANHDLSRSPTRRKFLALGTVSAVASVAPRASATAVKPQMVVGTDGPETVRFGKGGAR